MAAYCVHPAKVQTLALKLLLAAICHGTGLLGPGHK